MDKNVKKLTTTIVPKVELNNGCVTEGNGVDHDNIPSASMIHPMLNIGCLFDIPTGQYVPGTRGESILNGGTTTINLLQGPGNSFKSEIINYLAMSVVKHIPDTNVFFYDSENSMSYERLQHAAAHVPMDHQHLATTADTLGDVWFDEIKKIGSDFIAHKKERLFKTPMVGNKGEVIEVMLPVPVIVDTLSEFKVSKVQKQDTNDNGFSGIFTNTPFMSDDLAKIQLLTQLPSLSTETGMLFFMVAHTGEAIDMGDPFASKSVRGVCGKPEINVKGVPQEWKTINANRYEIINSKALYNGNTRYSLYPKDDVSGMVESNDLYMVNVVGIGNEGDQSDIKYELIASRSEGILDGLTMFHYIMEHDQYGIADVDTIYALDLYPKVKITSATIRSLVSSDYRMFRAVEITAQMLQMHKLWSDKELGSKYRCTPAELYMDLKKKGYDWNVLLDTRGWWCLQKDEHMFKPFLSTMDLLKMRIDEYTPYWLTDMREAKK